MASNRSPSRVLITGASVAGPSLAFWLDRAGHEVTVLERSPQLRPGGQNIDIRGPGREVVRRMGLEAEMLARNTTEQGIRFVDRRGATIAELPAGDENHDGPTAELEILRGELARVLVDAAGPNTVYRYGDRITGLAQDDGGVDVTFTGGDTERFDLVFLAEGIRSSSRDLVFPGEAQTRELGLYTAYGTLPRTDGDDAWWRWFNAPGARVVGLRPDNVGTTRFSLSWLSEPRGYEAVQPADAVSAIVEKFGDAGWETPRILTALENGTDTELYIDYLAQVQAPRWSNGRIAMVGDCAWCATPLSGVGTTLSITGAYVLAGELAAAPDHRTAFAQYEARMRPFVDRAQKLPPGTPRAAHPRSRAGVAALAAGLRVAGSAPVRAFAGKFLSPDETPFDLPDYEMRGSSAAGD